MMANEEIVMETVMLTITVTNETSKENTLLWQIEYWGQELFTLVQKYMCLYVYSTQFVYRQFFCNFLVLALLAKLFEEDIISFTAWSNQHCILSEEGEGGSQSTYSVFFW